MPAAVPAVWAEAGGRRDLESVRSKRLAVCNIQPRQHCSLAGNPGVLLDPLQWPLELWGSRGWVSRPGCRHAWSHPCGPPAHPASCSTLPRPSCSPAAGVLQAAGAAGLWGQAPRSEDRRGCGHPLAQPSLADWSSHGGAHTLTDLFVILFPGLGVVRLASRWRLRGLTLGGRGRRGRGRAGHGAWGLLVVV